MTTPRLTDLGRRRAFIVLAALASFSCGDDTPTEPPVPVLTTVTVTLPASGIQVGETSTPTVAGLDQNGAAIVVPTVTWSTASSAIATVSPAGVITGVSAGTTQVIATAGSKTGQQTITVNAPAGIRINEVESNGGTPGDWVELYNPTAAAVDLAGWGFRDNDTTRIIYRFPAGTTIPAGGYFLAEEAAFGFGLGAADDARLFSKFNVVVDTYSWTAHAALTYSRCPNGTGAFAASNSTKGATNNCTPVGPVVGVWPGTDNVQTVDGLNVFQTNLSGLTYEAATGASPNVLWAVRNGPGTLYRLIFSGGIWTPDPANGWGAGKALRYTNDLGNPDSEGVTYAAGGSAGGIYVATERNNDASTISRSSILRFDPSAAGTSLRATHDFNITADLPVVGANLGIEAITWIPDSALVANRFYDETAGKTYAPADYPNHGTGLFFVGVEGNGIIYAYALDHTASTARRIASFTSGNPGVMALEYDRESGYLWSWCDDTCGNKAQILTINQTAGATLGRFLPPREFAKPSTLPNINNEGFAFTSNAECVGGTKPVFWADDAETAGHSIRTARIQCGVVAAKIPVTPLRP